MRCNKAFIGIQSKIPRVGNIAATPQKALYYTAKSTIP